MTRAEHIISLIRYRFVRTGLAQGMSQFEAQSMAEQVMKNQGLFGFMGKAKAMATPDATISTIIETYLNTLKLKLANSADFCSSERGSEERSNASQRVNIEVFREIENFRSRQWPGAVEYPTTLIEYIIYRLKLEVAAQHNIDSDLMGLDEITIRKMSEMSLEYHRSSLNLC